MGVNDIFNYVIFDNPVSRKVTSMVWTPKSLGANQIQIVSEKIPLWKLAAEHGPFVRLAGLAGASAVALGAYGAHKTYPKDKAVELKHVFETGNRYHFLHSLALLGVPMSRNPKLCGAFLIVGTTFFAGACYYHAFTGKNKFSKLAPIGGTLLIAGWLTMIL